MAIIKERVSEIRKKYSYDEILAAYIEIRHEMSLGREIKTFHKNDGIIRNIECIAFELSKIYLNTDLLAHNFVEPAKIINDTYDIIEIKNLKNFISKDIDVMCTNIANRIKKR